MKKWVKIHITDFIADIRDIYGLNFDRYDIPPIINQSGNRKDLFEQRAVL